MRYQIKANVVFGMLSGRGLALMALVGAIAGVSERLVPSLVAHVERSFARGSMREGSKRRHLAPPKKPTSDPH